MQSWQQAVEAIKQVQTRKGRAAFGRFVMEGTRHVERALRAGLRLEAVVAGESYWDATPRLSALRSLISERCVRVLSAPDEAIAELVGGRKLGAIIGLAKVPDPLNLEQLIAEQANSLSRSKLLKKSLS